MDSIKISTEVSALMTISGWSKLDLEVAAKAGTANKGGQI